MGAGVPVAARPGTAPRTVVQEPGVPTEVIQDTAVVSGAAAVVLATAAPPYENPTIATPVTGVALAPSLTVRVAAIIRFRAPP